MPRHFVSSLLPTKLIVYKARNILISDQNQLFNFQTWRTGKVALIVKVAVFFSKFNFLLIWES